MNIVVDTWIIETANNDGYAEIEFLIKFNEKQCTLVVDSEYQIMNEYNRYLKGFTRKWFKLILESHRIEYSSGKIPQKLKIHLDGVFDPSDIKFLDVAYSTQEKIIVSGDPDYYSEPANSIIRDIYQINVQRTQDGINYLIDHQN